MVNHAVIKTPSQTVNLTYGTYALKRFCTLMGCGPGVFDVLAVFQGSTFYDATVSTILAGAEHAALAAKQPFTLTEFAVCALLDEDNDPEQGTYMMNALIGSIMNKTPEETAAWFAELKTSEPAAETESEVEKKKPLTWTDIEQLAYGEIGLTPYIFLYEMSMGQFTLTTQGYWKKQERLSLDNWQCMRRHAYTIYGMMGGKEDESQFMPLPGDAAPAPKPKRGRPAGNTSAEGGIRPDMFLTMLLGKTPTVVTNGEPEFFG